MLLPLSTHVRVLMAGATMRSQVTLSMPPWWVVQRGSRVVTKRQHECLLLRKLQWRGSSEEIAALHGDSKIIRFVTTVTVSLAVKTRNQSCSHWQQLKTSPLHLVHNAITDEAEAEAVEEFRYVTIALLWTRRSWNAMTVSLLRFWGFKFIEGFLSRKFLLSHFLSQI